MRFTKVGMRTIKTVIAVILTLIASEIFKLNSPILASIAAVMIMEGSVSKSLSSGKHRMYGTIIGGIVGLILLYIGPGNLLFIGLGIILIINTTVEFKVESAARMAMVVFLVIILDYEKDGDAFSYAINRTFDTLVGVVISIVVNYVIRPPKIEKRIERLLNNMYLEVRNLINSLVWEEEFGSLNKLRNQINKMEENYKVYMDDMKLQIGLDNNIGNYQKLFNHFEKIRNNLSAIKGIEKGPYIYENNKERLEKNFNKEIPEQKISEKTDLDLVYNFHIEEILNRFESIEDIFKNDLKNIKPKKPLK